MKLSLQSVSKFLTALIGVAAEAVDAGFVHGTAAKIIAVIIAAATAAGVYAVPNKGAPATPPPKTA